MTKIQNHQKKSHKKFTKLKIWKMCKIKVVCTLNRNLKEMEEEVLYKFCLEVMTPVKISKEISNITKKSKLILEMEEKNISLLIKI